MAEPQPVPINAMFQDDFVTQLALVLDTDTMDEVATKVAHHVVGRRQPPDGGEVPGQGGARRHDGGRSRHRPAAQRLRRMGDGMSELVGPVLRMSDDIDGIVAAIRDDNPDREVTVTDRGAYVRIEAPGFLRVTRESVARYLGRDFELRRLETMMSAFAGRIDNRTDEITWAYKNDLSATAAKPAH